MSKAKKIILILITTAIVVFISVVVFYLSSLRPVNNSKDVVQFQIVEGDTTRSITSRLEADHLIRSADMAVLHARFNGIDAFVPGTYEIQSNWDTPKILDYLSNPDNKNTTQVLLTFREGIWAKDIAKIIEENTNVKADDLLALWNDDAFLKTLIDRYEFLDDSILNDAYRVKLEGYLFPETYYFSKNTTPEDVTYIFLNQFEVIYNKLKDDFNASDMSIHEIVILSSVVQHEARNKEDMEMIAGVFFNRLAINQKLESSSTVCYAIYDVEDWLDCEKKTGEADSPYNTYLYPGLPIGPILNPGYDAMYATLHPKKHDYLFFLADIQGDGTIYYAKTYEEHLRNQDKYIYY